MTEWSLPKVLTALHNHVEHRLTSARLTLGHPGTKGAASENVWLTLLKDHLPHRYQAANAFVVDSRGSFSDQIDIVVFDRQYTPFVFNFEGQPIIPAEAVYAVFEAKQSMNAAEIAYAHGKLASVRRLHRTSLPIPSASGLQPPKPLHHILGGLLTLESDWSPPFGGAFSKALGGAKSDDERLDLCCVAAHGLYGRDAAGWTDLAPGGKPATAFLFELIARLQQCATVPMIDVRAYATWLNTGQPA
ncbi:DUF6602 domain-containing protein [Azospirillum soli]|uniref:DUF6602 domain-containing protein n=1 Tax=Azospirillum soli TaxID=1304799 RepID=UPI001AE95D97|nr:DUF6602 domain-containing protein [Azospirillum soli]MBP2310737.1 hypothetical protein [Azospirillum soli]